MFGFVMHVSPHFQSIYSLHISWNWKKHKQATWDMLKRIMLQASLLKRLAEMQCIKSPKFQEHLSSWSLSPMKALRNVGFLICIAADRWREFYLIQS
jgi:hypothetical protein